MSSTSFSLVTAQFSCYVGLPIFNLGIIGNLINIRLLFSTRLIPCSFLLLVSSMFNLVALSVGLLPRLLSLGFSIDSSSTNLVWCKSRLFVSYTSTVMSLTCICLASIDRFFVTCRSVVWRNRSKLSTARLAIAIAILVSVGVNMPYLLFYNIVETRTAAGNITTRCSLTSPSLVVYGNYFLRPFLLGILPSVMLITMGVLTYRNINSVTGQQLRGTFQRNLTSMLLLQIVMVVIPIAPFATVNVYQSLTSAVVKTSERLAQETFASDLANIFLYVNYACNFYVYLLSSSCYRRDFLQLVCCSHRPFASNRTGIAGTTQVEMRTASVIRPRQTGGSRNLP